MFGISFTELALVCFVSLIIFGPDKLPEVASKLGKFFGTFRKTSDKFRQEFYNSVYIPAKDFEKNVEKRLVAVKEDLTPDLLTKAPGSTETTDEAAKLLVQEEKVSDE